MIVVDDNNTRKFFFNFSHQPSRTRNPGKLQQLRNEAGKLKKSIVADLMKNVKD